MVAAALTVLGMTNGALTLIRAELLVRHYPPEVFGTVNGRLSRVVNLAQAATPLAAGWVFMAAGANYVPSLAVMTGLGAWAFLTLWSGLRQTH